MAPPHEILIKKMVNCPEEYIGDTGRAFGEIQRTSQGPIPKHTSSTGHPISPDCSSIVDREGQGTTRYIKEAMFIRANDPSLNRT